MQPGTEPGPPDGLASQLGLLLHPVAAWLWAGAPSRAVEALASSLWLLQLYHRWHAYLTRRSSCGLIGQLSAYVLLQHSSVYPVAGLD